MKKSLIALAVLAASGAAMAQSSVTLYGRIDTAVGSIKDKGSSAANRSSITKMFQGGDAGLTTSRWGLRGTEDLGGGLKASFKLENRFNPDEGTSQDPFFKGESSLSLSGGFGELKFGRSTTQYDDVIALSSSSSVFDSAFTPSTNGVYKSGGDYSSRFNNKITYNLPNLGGIYGGVDFAFDEDATKKADQMALKLGYKAGPMNVALGYQDEKTVASYTALSGAYDFGVASVSGGYVMRDSKTNANEDTEFALGVNVPFGAVAVSAGFASSKTEAGSATVGKASGFAFGATYALSKRTKAYAGYRAVQVKNAAGTKTKDETLYSVGLRHDF
jgi:predicted porin